MAHFYWPAVYNAPPKFSEFSVKNFQISYEKFYLGALYAKERLPREKEGDAERRRKEGRGSSSYPK